MADAVAIALATALAVAQPEMRGDAYLDEIAERTPPGLVRDGIGNAMALLPLDDPRSAAASLGNGRYISAPSVTHGMNVLYTCCCVDETNLWVWAPRGAGSGYSRAARRSAANDAAPGGLTAV